MLQLPTTVGPYTLHRRLGGDGVSDSFFGSSELEGRRRVVVRLIAP